MIEMAGIKKENRLRMERDTGGEMMRKRAGGDEQRELQIEQEWRS